jgi:hypothetical protein
MDICYYSGKLKGKFSDGEMNDRFTDMGFSQFLKPSELQGGFVPLCPLPGLCPGPTGDLKTPRLFTPPLTTNPGSAPGTP